MLLRTPLHDDHAAAGATFTEFAGYDMPVHYGSIKEEHLAVRNAVGLFDVSHMSNLWVRGPHAAAALARVTPSDPTGIEIGKGKYTVVLREDGTILDDAFYFRTEEDVFFLIPNAGMNRKVRDHIAMHTPDVGLEDVTRDWAILALQGPEARGVLQAASKDTPPKFHRITEMDLAGVSCLVSGTGYTGERGVELYVPADQAQVVWRHLMASGKAVGIRPVGLGARDTLRLEKGYCLASHEFAGGRTPLEANLDWLIDWNGSFLGKEALERQRSADRPFLWGLVLEKGVPRQGYHVHRDGHVIGTITSGTMSPMRNDGIALAYLDGASKGDEVQVDVRGKAVAAEVVMPPFV